MYKFLTQRLGTELGCVGTVPMRYIVKINDLRPKNRRVLLFNNKVRIARY